MDADFLFDFLSFEMNHFGGSLDGSLYLGLGLLGTSVAEEKLGCGLLESAALI